MTIEFDKASLLKETNAIIKDARGVDQPNVLRNPAVVGMSAEQVYAIMPDSGSSFNSMLVETLLNALEAANTQMRIAYECVEVGRYDEALLHLGSMSRQRTEAISKAKAYFQGGER